MNDRISVMRWIARGRQVEGSGSLRRSTLASYQSRSPAPPLLRPPSPRGSRAAPAAPPRAAAAPARHPAPPPIRPPPSRSRRPAIAPDGGVGIPLVAGHVHVARARSRPGAAAARRAASRAIVVQPLQRDLQVPLGVLVAGIQPQRLLVRADGVEQQLAPLGRLLRRAHQRVAQVEDAPLPERRRSAPRLGGSALAASS